MSTIALSPHSSGRVFQFLGVVLLLITAGMIVLGAKGPSELDANHQRLLLMVLGGVIGLFAIFFFYLGFGLEKVGVSVTDKAVEITGPLYGRSIPRSSLKVGEAKVVDLQGEYNPTRRRNGIGLPRLRFGWFKRSNDEKVFVVAGDSKQAVYVPTQDGYSLIVTPSDPEAFLKALR